MAGENVRLVVVVFGELGSHLLPNSSSSLEVQTVIVNAQAFSRSVGLDRGASLMQPDDLMFFVDVDIRYGHNQVSK